MKLDEVELTEDSPQEDINYIKERLQYWNEIKKKLLED